MGCLFKLIKFIIIILAIVGIFTVGKTILRDKFNINIFGEQSQEKLVEKASKIADFSHINEEYKLKKTANILGFNTVIAEHKGSGQKLIVSNEGKKNFLTKRDFVTKNVDKKLQIVAEKMQYQMVRIEDLEITQRGTFTTMGQTVPFVKFEATTVNLPISSVKGIVGAATNKNKETLLIISVNDGKKYSQIITQEFFKDVR